LDERGGGAEEAERKREKDCEPGAAQRFSAALSNFSRDERLEAADDSIADALNAITSEISPVRPGIARLISRLAGRLVSAANAPNTAPNTEVGGFRRIAALKASARCMLEAAA
jgi:hypothetical protein